MYRYRYQTFGSRFLAAMIDGFILSITARYINTFLWQDYNDTIGKLLISNGLFYFYSIFLHYKFGQTLGKKIAQVIVVSNSDESKLIGLANSFKRDSVGILISILGILVKVYHIDDTSFSHYLILFSTSGWLLAELVTMLFNEKRRAVHDFLGNSVVIDSRVYVKSESNQA
jgi:uncharacterized RDD family membrane protein YckC